MKRIIIFAMAVVMLFSVIAFGAGHCVMYDPRVGELQRRIEELEEENRILRLELRRFEAVRELGEFFECFDEEDYVWWNWGYIEGFVERGIEAIGEAESIDELENILLSTKNNIHAVPIREWGYSECGRFALSLSLWGYVVDENLHGMPGNRGGRASVIYHEFRNLTDEEFLIRGGFFYDMPWERWNFLRSCQYNSFIRWDGMYDVGAIECLYFWLIELYRFRGGRYDSFLISESFLSFFSSPNRLIEKNVIFSGLGGTHFTPFDENHISIRRYMAFYINFGEYNQERVEFASNLLINRFNS